MHTMKKAISLTLAILMMLSLLPVSVLAEDEAEAPEEAITREYGDFVFTKISNPTSGSGEPDGINTNDLTGFDANRLNSYAWAVVSRGDYIYVGTNRTLFGSALNAVIENNLGGVEISREKIMEAIEFVSGGDMPVDLTEEDYIPQIIKVDVKNGSTEVIYQPATGLREDGVRCYLDKNGEIVANADVASETASFRSVVEFNGNLYFGSLGSNMISLIRIDEEDKAEVVYQAVGLVSSLRANCRYGEGVEETIYFGGFDTTYQPWQAYLASHPGDPTMPIIIRYLDPTTAGTDHEDWSGIIADYRDFGKYAGAQVYVNGGGNVWDMCSYNGCIYLVLAYDSGWALFRGEKATMNARGVNEFGWKWTEIVGDDSIYNYPLGMNQELAELNAAYTDAYNCVSYGASMKTAGLLESTATPYVFDGKMYLGTFDNATVVQSETVTKAIRKLNCMMTGEAPGPSLTAIFGPIYQVLSHPQHIWVMDENENIVAVDAANELLDGTTNDYVWRFVEHQGKLYTGTFDASSAYTYFLNGPVSGLINQLQASGVEVCDTFKAWQDGSYRKDLLASMENLATKGANMGDILALMSAVDNALKVVGDFLNDEATVEELLAAMEELKEARDAVFSDDDSDEGNDYLQQIREKIDYLLTCFDVEGLQYWAKARALANHAQRGFDVFVTKDGENWEPVVRDGAGDPYNYGARTFTVCNDELYVGTANPYYGAQLWKITEEHKHDWSEPAYEWAKDNSSVTATRVCQKDSTHTETETVGTTSEVTISATCTEKGETTYTTATFANPAFETQVKAVENIDPLGHDMVQHEAKDATCTEVGWDAYEACSRCEYSTYVETPSLGHNYETAVTEPTCNEEGYTTYTCNRCGDSYTDDATEALGHEWDEGNVTVEPKYQTPGEMQYTCTRCGETKTEEIANLANPFEDVHDEDFFFNPVMWALDETVTGGIDDTHFGPERTVMRADAMVFFWAANGRPAYTATEKTFKDVKEKHWAYEAVMWAVENGITGGTDAEGNYFSPQRTCTRSEILQFLYAAMGKPEYTIENPYSDVKTKHWYYDGAIWAYEMGLEKGTNGKFQAKTPCTRGCVVTYLYRFFTGKELAE